MDPRPAPVTDLPVDEASPAASRVAAGAFRVWAPRAGRVDLELDGVRHALEAAEHGWWEARVPVAAGARYGFRLDDGPVLPDPRSIRLPDGPHGLSQVYDPASFTWTDTAWTGCPLEGAVLYELHVGTFTAEGTFTAAIDRLDALVDLGVDVIELMPVAAFPGRHGWGYDGVSPWAVHEPYGGPEGLQRFVDAAHARGLAVCLDVVYNHLGPDGSVLGVYGPYFTDRHHTPWGKALNLDGPDSDPVREFVVANAVHWLREFHLDGLRLDAVHELYDTRAIHVLEELSTRVRALEEETGRGLWLVAESDRNDPRTVLPVDAGGLGLDAQWADDVHHGLHVALTGERQGYYDDFAAPEALRTVLASPYFHAGTWSSFRGRTHGRPVPAGVPGWRFVAFLQNHDQVGNRRTGDRHAHAVPLRSLMCGAALLLTSPYTPLLFMGEEWGASTPWQYFTDHTDDLLAEAVRDGRRSEFAGHGWAPEQVPDPQDPETRDRSVLDWSEREAGEHRKLLRWYKALLALRRARVDLRDPDLSAVVVHQEPGRPVVVVERGRHRVAVNLGRDRRDVDLHLDDAQAIASRRVVVLLSNDPTVTLSEEGTVPLAPGAVAVVGPSTVADE